MVRGAAIVWSVVVPVDDEDGAGAGAREWWAMMLVHFNLMELQVIAIHSSRGASGGRLFVWLLIVEENGPGPMVFTARSRILRSTYPWSETGINACVHTYTPCPVILHQWCIHSVQDWQTWVLSPQYQCSNPWSVNRCLLVPSKSRTSRSISDALWPKWQSPEELRVSRKRLACCKGPDRRYWQPSEH